MFARFADPHRDFLDVGAHIGYCSLYLSPLVRRVFAFEPDPRNLPGLSANVAIADNVAHVAAAVSDRSGTVYLDIPGSTAASQVAERGLSVRRSRSTTSWLAGRSGRR